MKPILFCALLIGSLCAVIIALIIMYFSMKRQRTYWKDKAIAEARKRLAKDDAKEHEHQSELAGLRRDIGQRDARIAELERNNNILRRMNEQLRRGTQEGGTKCP